MNFSYVSSDTSGVFEYVKTDKCGIVDVSDTRDMPYSYWQRIDEEQQHNCC